MPEPILILSVLAARKARVAIVSTKGDSGGTGDGGLLGIDQHDVLARPDGLEARAFQRGREPLDRIGVVESPDVRTEVADLHSVLLEVHPLMQKRRPHTPHASAVRGANRFARAQSSSAGGRTSWPRSGKRASNSSTAAGIAVCASVASVTVVAIDPYQTV